MNDIIHGRKGGKARALALSDDQRTEIAKKAAAARWGEKPLQATHRGNFKDDFGIDVDCYVLNDDQKTAVISQRGMAVALGLSASGNAFTIFVSSRKMTPLFAGTEMQEKIRNPFRFQWGSGGKEQPPNQVNGYDVTILIDVCKAIIAAEQKGARLLPRVTAQARIILNASAKSGIKGLVYALAGYDATREEVITAFKTFVRDEAREYEREFPDQLYQEWYRLYQIPKPERNKPWKFMHLTVDQVYHPLAKSSGKILELTRAQRANADRKGKLHQFLSEVGVKALRQQLGQLLAIARLSQTKQQYEGFFEQLFGTQGELFPK